MKNRSAVKDLSELKTVVAAANLSLVSKTTPKVGVIGKSKLMTVEAVREITEAVKALVGALREHYEALAAVLTDPEGIAYQADEIAAEEQQLTEAILSTSEGRPREVVALAAAEAMVELYPHTVVGIERFTAHAVAIGFLRPLKSGEKKFFVELPVNGAWTQLVSDVTNSTAVLARLLTIAGEVADAAKKARQEKTRTLRAGTANLLAVIAAGVGETVCFVPGGKKDDRNFPDVFLSLKVADGYITVSDAAGSKFVETLIGFWIPSESLKHEKFSRAAIEGLQPEQVKAMATVRRFIIDGIAHAENLRKPKPQPAPRTPRNAQKPAPATPAEVVTEVAETSAETPVAVNGPDGAASVETPSDSTETTGTPVEAAVEEFDEPSDLERRYQEN